MKKIYKHPVMKCEEFQTTEFISACGASGVVYKFTCDAGYVEKPHTATKYGFLGIPVEICGCGVNHGSSASGTYQAAGHWTVRDSSGNKLTGSSYYHPCGTTHEADSDGIFILGTMDNQATDEIEAIPVMIWRGENGNNVHCTTKLDMNSWETAKS